MCIVRPIGILLCLKELLRIVCEDTLWLFEEAWIFANVILFVQVFFFVTALQSTRERFLRHERVPVTKS